MGGTWRCSGRSYLHGLLQERTTRRPSYIFISLGTRKFLMGGGMLSPITLEERAGAADRTDVWDPGWTCGIGPEEVDPS